MNRIEGDGAREVGKGRWKYCCMVEGSGSHHDKIQPWLKYVGNEHGEILSLVYFHHKKIMLMKLGRGRLQMYRQKLRFEFVLFKPETGENVLRFICLQVAFHDLLSYAIPMKPSKEILHHIECNHE